MATQPLASSGSPNWGRIQNLAHMWAKRLHHPAISGPPNAQRGEEIRNGSLRSTVSVSLVGAKWLHNPFLLGDPQIEDEFITRPTGGERGYVAPAASGVPAASTGRKSELGQHVRKARKPCRLEGPQIADEFKIRPTYGQSGYIPLVVSVVPNAQRKEEIRNGYLNPAISGPLWEQNGYITPAFLGYPDRGQIQNAAHMWAKRLHHPCSLGGP